MKSFTQFVRNGAVPQPTQRSFTLASWNKSFEGFEKASDEDTRLYRTGVWAFKKLEAVRRKLTSSWLDGISNHQLLMMYVAFANRVCQLVAKATPSPDDKIIISEQIIQAKLEQSFSIGAADPDSILLSSIDGLRFPLQKAFLQTEKPAAVTIEETEIIDHIKITAVLGQIYNIIEGYWMQALWNGWFVEPRHDGSDLIRPPQGIAAIVSSISVYRRQALMLEAGFHFNYEWQHSLSNKAKSELVSTLPRILLKHRKGLAKFDVRAREKEDHGAVALLQNRIQAERSYYTPLMNELLPQAGKVTLKMLLEAWEVLYALAESMMQKIPGVKDSGVYTSEKLLKYAPTIHKEVLIGLVRKWCRFSASDAERIVEFFSYARGSKLELWGHPLVKVDDNQFAITFAPILYGNLERTFELWMKDGGLKLSEKGPLFESYIRENLIRSLSKSSGLRNARVYPTSVVLRDDLNTEQIDLVIRIGATVLIGEAKCLLFPSDPIEFSRYSEVLQDAAAQVLRKANFAERNKKILAERLELPSDIRIDELVIMPFVLVNQPSGAGCPVEGVPVVDEWILKRFFDGKWYRLVQINEVNEYEAESTFLLFDNDDDAAKRVISYLQDPPQLKHYRENIKVEVHTYPAIDREDQNFAAANLEVVLPLPELTFKL